MNRIAKNAVVIFTLLCAIFLIVFCAELIIVNSEDETGKTDPAMSDDLKTDDKGGDDSSEKIDTKQPEGNAAQESSGQNEGGALPEKQKTTPTGKRYDLSMLDDVHTLVLYADEELFDYEEEETSWLLTYNGGGGASLEIALVLISPQDGVAIYSENFLDNYLDGGRSSVGGVKQIGDSSLSGIFIIGDKNEETYEAWIHGPFGGGDSGRAVVFVIHYREDEQRDALYGIIDTLDMLSD